MIKSLVMGALALSMAGGGIALQGTNLSTHKVYAASNHVVSPPNAQVKANAANQNGEKAAEQGKKESAKADTGKNVQLQQGPNVQQGPQGNDKNETAGKEKGDTEKASTDTDHVQQQVQQGPQGQGADKGTSGK